MPMRCDVERRGAGTDPYGGPGEFEPHLSGLACSWWVSSGREAVSDDRSAVVVDEHLIVPRDTDVREGDQVPSVTDREGRTIVERTRTVEHVAVERSHLDLSLRAVS